MKFWGVEVKSGETVKVTPGEDMILHLSQANLGEVKKGKNKESVYLFVNVDGKKLVLGTLSCENLPQQQFDLVFDRDFELSHSLKGGSVYFLGFKESDLEDEDDMQDYSDSEDEDIPLSHENIGKPVTKVKEEESVGDDISDDDDDDDDADMDEDESDDSEDEDEPTKAAPGNKKRASNTEHVITATKKKAKVTTTQEKTGGGVHVDTSSKKKGKKTPKSSGGRSHVCKSC